MSAIQATAPATALLEIDALAVSYDGMRALQDVSLRAQAGEARALLAEGVMGARPAPVRMGVVLKALDNPFFVAMYEGVKAEAKQLRARTSVRAAASSSAPGSPACPIARARHRATSAAAVPTG